MNRLLILSLAMVIALTGCTSRRMISPTGLAYARIGGTMPAPGDFKVKGHAVRDTVFEDGRYEWRVAQVRYAEGMVYVEEDFYGSGKISRIRVETGQLRLRNGLQTGKTVAELSAISDDWYISPMPKYGLFDFYSRLFPRTHFVVDAPGVPTDKAWEDYRIQDFPVQSRIVMITVY